MADVRFLFNQKLSNLICLSKKTNKAKNLSSRSLVEKKMCTSSGISKYYIKMENH